MSVDLACAAITAQAMTVLPDPGGATSTPCSWWASSPAACRWTLVNVPVKANVCSDPADRSSLTSNRLPASSASEVTVPIRPRGRIRPPSKVSSKLCTNRDTFQVEARMRCRS